MSGGKAFCEVDGLENGTSTCMTLSDSLSTGWADPPYARTDWVNGWGHPSPSSYPFSPLTPTPFLRAHLLLVGKLTVHSSPSLSHTHTHTSSPWSSCCCNVLSWCCSHSHPPPNSPPIPSPSVSQRPELEPYIGQIGSQNALFFLARFSPSQIVNKRELVDPFCLY